jgi:acyl-coenzyme A synthetase/AMP-(fatty) acid ligase
MGDIALHSGAPHGVAPHGSAPHAADAGPGLLRAWIDRAAERHPDKPYVISADDGRSLSYGDLRRYVRGIAAFLRAEGIATGDRIALAADNSIEHVLCYLGGMAYGATVCTVHVEMNRPHLPRILAQLRPRLVIHDEGIELPSMAPCLAIGRCDAPAAGSFFAGIDPDSDAEHFLTETTARDDGVIFFTSGTSDTPKGVVLSYREQLGNILPMTEGFGITGEDRIYDFRSFNWASAQLLGVLAPLARGATLVMAKKFSATRFFEDVRSHRVTVAAGNPTVINMLLASPIKIGPRDVPSLRFLTSSSAPLLPQEWQRFEERFGIPVAQGYGSSETAWIAVNPGHARRFGSVGRPLAYHRLAIVGADGRALPAGESGHVELGAWDDNDFRYLGKDGSVRVNSRGRMRTGDIGYLDADGYLFLTGREKELIIRGGVNISPVEIDGVLMQRVEVSEAATIGVPDAIWGEEVVSYVVLAPGSSFAPDELMRFCAARLTPFKAPKQILLRDVLPKSERGKLDRKALFAEWMRARDAPNSQ